MKIVKITKVHLEEPKVYYDVINAGPYHNYLTCTDSSYICSHNCFIDEVNFQRNMDVEKQKKYAQEIVSSASARMQSRFMKGESNPTILFIASSKRTDQSYLETFVDKKKKNESKTTIIVDEPQWVIRTDKDSKVKFKVALGNKFLDSEVLPLDITDDEVSHYIDRGYQILEVPMGYYENFIDDIDIALTDIAGISTSNVSRYISGPRVAAIKNSKLKNLFTKDIIEVGNAPDDALQYYDFIDMNNIDKSMISKPLFIHLDMAVSGDKAGIAGTWILGKKAHIEGVDESKELFYRLAFSVSVKAPKGHQISFEKTRQFIRWLKRQGFAIKVISADTFQSVDILQRLQAEGFETEVLSVDRVDAQSHMCLPYQTLKSAIYEQRVEIYDSKLLTEELIGLERHNDGHVDHSERGVNSKDMCDGFCGSLFTASKHAEEFSFEYGETLDSIIDVSGNSAEMTVKQITVDFETELQKVFGNHEDENFMDFGLGKSMPLQQSYLSQGIII